jgi:hypothetical protein
MTRYVTEQGRAALDEFGFRLVPLDRPGAATPGRIADRLSDATGRLDDAAAARDWAAVLTALAELRRLRLALDAYDVAMMRIAHDRRA